MERLIRNGDYVPDGAGGLCGLTGAEEVLQRALFRLTARRGALPFLPELGSRLHLLLREKPGAQQALATRYVEEALEGEPDLRVTRVELTQTEGKTALTAQLEWQGETLTVSTQL